MNLLRSVIMVRFLSSFTRWIIHIKLIYRHNGEGEVRSEKIPFLFPSYNVKTEITLLNMLTNKPTQLQVPIAAKPSWIF